MEDQPPADVVHMFDLQAVSHDPRFSEDAADDPPEFSEDAAAEFSESAADPSRVERLLKGSR